MIGQKGYPPIHGGIERHVAELGRRLGARGFQVEIYSRPHYSSLDGPTGEPGILVRRLPSIPTKHLDAISHSLLATADALRRRPDVVHYHALGPGLLAGLPRAAGRLPTVVTVHGLDWQRQKWGRVARAVLRVGESASVRLPDRTIVVSRALQEHYRERHGRQTVYIPNGIAPPVYKAPESIRGLGVERPFVLFVGRLVPEKGCHLLLEAWTRLPSDLRAAFQLVIAGDAGFTRDYAGRLRAAAGPGVVFTGFVHGAALEELYTNAELIVLPSTMEGLSIALLEGMSYARCCLASDIPPNREAAAGQAPLFPSGDVAALAARTAELLLDPEARRRYGQGAQIHAIETYSWERVADLTAELYRDLLGSKVPVGRASEARPGGGTPPGARG